MAIKGSIRLPPEIITEILRRLPSKSLGRFKCVSKDWLSLISQPQFIKTHQNTLNRNHFIFLSDVFSLYSLPFNHHQSSLSIPMKVRLESFHLDMFSFHGSCNGLVLATAHRFDGADLLVIINPTTREFLELPYSTHHVYGFGYDPLTDDYKIFTIYYFPHTCLVSVQVYSLRTRTSNLVTGSPYLPYSMCLRGVFVNGFLHWIAKKKDESHDYLPVILAFSLADKELSEVPLPNRSDGVDILFYSDCKLDAVGERLAIFIEAKGKVWLMNDYGIRESWTKILGLKLDDNLVIEPRILYDNGKILLASNDRMLIYDVEKSSFCGSIDFAANLDHLNVMCICSKSLVSTNFS